jgi:hypothetical protein
VSESVLGLVTSVVGHSMLPSVLPWLSTSWKHCATPRSTVTVAEYEAGRVVVSASVVGETSVPLEEERAGLPEADVE